MAGCHQPDDLDAQYGADSQNTGKAGMLMVQDSYVDVETTQYAHIFLPAAIWAEKEGVFTNTERRVNMIRQVTATLCRLEIGYADF